MYNMKIINFLIEWMRENPEIRKIFLISASIINILHITISSYLYFFHHPRVNQDVGFLLIILGVMFLSMFLVPALSYTSIHFKDIFDLELEKIFQERDTLEKKIQEAPKDDVLNTIQLSLNHITEYYTINKSQARKSFGFSVFAIIAGLVTILAGIWMYYFNTNPHIEITVITSVAGVLIEFIGAAYFHMYNKSIQQLNFFYEKLVTTQDTMLAIKLTETIDDRNKRTEVIEKIIEALLSRNNIERIL